MVMSAEINGRVARLQQGLAEMGLDGALLILPIDIYYYSGTRQNGVLWVPVQGDSQLLVRKSLARAQEEGVAGLIRPFPSSKEFPTLFPENVQRIGMTFDVVPVQQYQYYGKLLGGRDHSTVLRSYHKMATMVNTDTTIRGKVNHIATALRA